MKEEGEEGSVCESALAFITFSLQVKKKSNFSQTLHTCISDLCLGMTGCVSCIFVHFLLGGILRKNYAEREDDAYSEF